MGSILEKERRSLEDKVSKGKATADDVANKAKEIAAFKEIRQLKLFVDDVTSERLTSILAENRGRAAIASAEGGIFDILNGIYTKNVNIDVFLKGHSGDTIRVDRIGRASELIDHPALTMLLAVQPDVLHGLMTNGTFHGRGLTARFLYSISKSNRGNRKFYANPMWFGGLLYQAGRFAHGVDALSEGCRVSLHPFLKGMKLVPSGLFFHHSSVNFHDG